MTADIAPNFYSTELTKALKENSFRLKGFHVRSPTLTAVDSAGDLAQATARVELLEGLAVFIRLTFMGYEVCFFQSYDEPGR